jgi:hypothetical protein
VRLASYPRSHACHRGLEQTTKRLHLLRGRHARFTRVPLDRLSRRCDLARPDIVAHRLERMCKAGGILGTFGLVTPILLMGVAAAVDYGMFARGQSRLQAILIGEPASTSPDHALRNRPLASTRRQAVAVQIGAA